MIQRIDELKRELREGEERQKWEIEQKRQEGQVRLKARMLLRRKILAEKKKEKEKEKEREQEKEQEQEKEGTTGEEKKAEAVNLDDYTELEQRLLEAQKDCVVQRRKVFNAESLVEEKELEIKLLITENSKLKKA